MKKLYLVADIKNKKVLTMQTSHYTWIIPIEIKNNLCVMSNELYLTRKEYIDNLGISFVIREVAKDEWITNEE